MTTTPETHMGLRPGQRTITEIASQPQMWRRALTIGSSGVEGLPKPGERVLMLGCGTSYYVGLAYALLRETAGQGQTDALVASEVQPTLRAYDRVIAVSRSGTSSELLDAVTALRRQQPGVPVTVLLGEQGTPLADLATTVLDLSFADEQSVVQTRFPTTQLLLLRAALARTAGDEARLGAGLHDLDSLPRRAEEALGSPLPATGIRQLVILGHGWGTAIAEEGALKVREAAGAWAESYPVGEYRHGPIATAAPGTLVWGLDELPQDIAAAVRAAGGRTEDGCGEPLLELVRIHRYAVAMAAEAGRDADQPWHLSRSVVLPAPDGTP